MDFYEKRKEYQEDMGRYFKIARVYQETLDLIKNEYEADIRKKSLWLKLFITDMIVFVSVMLILIFYDVLRYAEGHIKYAIDDGKIIILIIGIIFISFLIILNRIFNAKTLRITKRLREENSHRYETMDRILTNASMYSKELLMETINIDEVHYNMLLDNRFPDGYTKRDMCDLYDEITNRKNNEYIGRIDERQRYEINKRKNDLYTK